MQLNGYIVTAIGAGCIVISHCFVWRFLYGVARFTLITSQIRSQITIRAEEVLLTIQEEELKA